MNKLKEEWNYMRNKKMKYLKMKIKKKNWVNFWKIKNDEITNKYKIAITTLNKLFWKLFNLVLDTIIYKNNIFIFYI